MSPLVVLTPDLIAERIERVRRVSERIVWAGLTRPARDPAKRVSLEAIGGLGPYEEGPTPRPTDFPARRR